MNNLIIKSEDQDIEKIGDRMSTLDNSLQDQPNKVNGRQVELETRIQRLHGINGLVGRIGMSNGNKQLLKIDHKANEEALQIIRTGENNNLSAIADYQTRYLKTILHNLVLIGETNMTGAAKLHYENTKMVLHEKLLKKLEEITFILQDFENRAKGRPEKFKTILIDASNKTLDQWIADFETHLAEYADLLKKTFSR